jgi:adenosylcobinamide kinase/adenosylcobinamide-phosphate guanylyltransferase
MGHVSGGGEVLNADEVLARAKRLCEALEKVRASVVLVSNEVGWGIVPENDLARLYRDLLGGVNRLVAKVADRVLLLVAGYPVVVKDATGGAQ